MLIQGFTALLVVRVMTAVTDARDESDDVCIRNTSFTSEAHHEDTTVAVATWPIMPRSSSKTSKAEWTVVAIS